MDNLEASEQDLGTEQQPIENHSSEHLSDDQKSQIINALEGLLHEDEGGFTRTQESGLSQSTNIENPTIFASTGFSSDYNELEKDENLEAKDKSNIEESDHRLSNISNISKDGLNKDKLPINEKTINTQLNTVEEELSQAEPANQEDLNPEDQGINSLATMAVGSAVLGGITLIPPPEQDNLEEELSDQDLESLLEEDFDESDFEEMHADAHGDHDDHDEHDDEEHEHPHHEHEHEHHDHAHGHGDHGHGGHGHHEHGHGGHHGGHHAHGAHGHGGHHGHGDHGEHGHGAHGHGHHEHGHGAHGHGHHEHGHGAHGHGHHEHGHGAHGHSHHEHGHGAHGHSHHEHGHGAHGHGHHEHGHGAHGHGHHEHGHGAHGHGHHEHGHGAHGHGHHEHGHGAHGHGHHEHEHGAHGHGHNEHGHGAHGHGHHEHGHGHHEHGHGAHGHGHHEHGHGAHGHGHHEHGHGAHGHGHHEHGHGAHGHGHHEHGHGAHGHGDHSHEHGHLEHGHEHGHLEHGHEHHEEKHYSNLPLFIGFLVSQFKLLNNSYIGSILQSSEELFSMWKKQIEPNEKLHNLIERIKSFGNYPVPTDDITDNEIKTNQKLSEMIYERIKDKGMEEPLIEESIVGTLLAFRFIKDSVRLQSRIQRIVQSINLDELEFESVEKVHDKPFRYEIVFVNKSTAEKVKHEISYIQAMLIHAKAIYIRALNQIEFDDIEKELEEEFLTHEEKIYIQIHKALNEIGITLSNVRYEAFIKANEHIFELGFENNLQGLFAKLKKDEHLLHAALHPHLYEETNYIPEMIEGGEEKHGETHGHKEESHETSSHHDDHGHH